LFDYLNETEALMTVRSIPRGLAPVLEELELDQPTLVTLSDLAEILSRIGRAGAATEAPEVAYQLQRRGWLGRLRTRGVWEFLPAARAGAFGSGDRFVELRACRRRVPGWPGVLAMESAASVLGLAQRLPGREVLALPPAMELPQALDDWRMVRLAVPPVGLAMIDDLPTWNLEGLLAGIASRPAGYRDLAGLGQWLPTIPGVDAARLATCLADAPQAARQRAAYLLGAAGQPGAAQTLAPDGAKPTAWFGPRRAGGNYDHASGVIDTLLAPYFAGGVGA
jgi:AbiEi antitoxin C-terminal domain